MEQLTFEKIKALIGERKPTANKGDNGRALIIAGNAVGIDVSNSGSGSPTVIGNANLAFGKGNKVFGNSSTGINANSNVLVSGNTVYGQSGSGDVGINLDYGAQAIQNGSLPL